MSRESAFRGTWQPNARPYITLTPDVYVAIQGETEVIGCGQCKRKINLNKYVTGASTEASIDAGAPGSATITLSVPDNDINDFYVDGQLLICSMMEVEIFSKGYFLVGGFPQYYRIFWGMVGSVTKAWSNGTTTITISCKDILRWWELTNVTINPAFTESFGSSTGNFTFWGNQFAGMNPYTIIIALAREAMGDFSLTTGSFNAFLPEKGPEGQVVAAFAQDIMIYWQLKFANIWNSLVLYGTSGQAYNFTGQSGAFSPIQISEQIFAEEERLNFVNQESNVFKYNPNEIATFKMATDKAADFDLFQSETQSKMALAMACRDQAGYEFYCDPSGDIVFKPPFFNLNVIPNKPISWIQNFEILDDSISESEDGVITHITASGNAFGGVTDYGINDPVTSPRTGAFDFHLLRRYGWRKHDYQCEWAGNPRKLFFHILDFMDRLNSKRQNGSVTIPLRPELKLGFPIWIPLYESFFYVSGISHQYSVGGQATTTLTLTAKRSKFIAPDNIGELKQVGVKKKKIKAQGKSTEVMEIKEASWDINFPDRSGSTTGASNTDSVGKPAIIRDPKTGKTLGFPNAVMVFRTSHKGEELAKIIESSGNSNTKQSVQGGKPGDKGPQGVGYRRQYVISDAFARSQEENKAELIAQLRAHRYEAGMTNAGAYDYAFDVSRQIKELLLLPVDSVTWGPSTAGGNTNNITNPNSQKAVTVPGATEAEQAKYIADAQRADATAQEALISTARTDFNTANTEFRAAQAVLDKLQKDLAPKKPPVTVRKDGLPVPEEQPAPQDPQITTQSAKVNDLKAKAVLAGKILAEEEAKLVNIRNNSGSTRRFTSLNMMVRPVSDEFGFEVIGHYRYGRGAFIDRGQIKISSSGDGDPSKIVNQVNIQFAATGGLITDRAAATTLDPGAVAFASTFENMQPDDYVTGASFKGAAIGKRGISQITETSQSTYTNLINANTGRSVFIEADQLRKSRTLAELSPTVEIGGLTGVTNQCDCQLVSSKWISYLPQDFIRRIMNSGDRVNGSIEVTDVSVDPINIEKKTQVEKETAAAIKENDDSWTKRAKELSDKRDAGKISGEDFEKQNGEMFVAAQKSLLQIQNAGVQRLKSVPTNNSSLSARKPSDQDLSLGMKDPSDFFKFLAVFLEDKFTKEYSSNNALRERKYTLSDRTILATNNLFDTPVQDNILSPPGGSLFDRASQGDTVALQALQDGANTNFGRTNQAADNFKAVWNAGTDKIRQTVVGQDPQTSEFPPGATVNVPLTGGGFLTPSAQAEQLPFAAPLLGAVLLNPVAVPITTPLIPTVGPAPNPASLSKLKTFPPSPPSVITVKKKGLP